MCDIEFADEPTDEPTCVDLEIDDAIITYEELFGQTSE